MYFMDHAPPHFHARYGEFEATIDLGTLEVREGQLPGRALSLVQEWAMIHREELLEDWRLCRENALPLKIEPFPERKIYMYWNVVDVKPQPGYRLFVRFEDGLSGFVQLRQEDLTGALAPLSDPLFFEQVFVSDGAVTWPGEIDLAPDAMYLEIARQSPELQVRGRAQ